MKIMILVLWLALTTDNPQISKGWKEIAPLHSTREEVERVLGSPTGSCTDVCHYQTGTESVFVRYSAERCGQSEVNPLDLPPNSVISVTVYSEVKPRLRDLKLNMRKFTRTMNPELRGYATYTNAEIGVSYEVSDQQVVLSVEWFGSAKDIQALRCR
jgi:hypothetical protein